MTRKKWITLGVGAVVIALFAAILLTTFNFKQEREEIFEDYTNQDIEEDIIFHNSSDLSENEIRSLTEEKRTSLKNLLENAQYYIVSEINSSYTQEDDETLMAIPESFLTELSAILTSDLYETYRSEMEEITVDQDITNINEPVYVVRKDIFDEASYNSAVAFYDVNEEQLILESATNEKITAIEHIKLCDENNPDNCTRDTKYRLILEKENEEWKIAEFENQII